MMKQFKVSCMISIRILWTCSHTLHFLFHIHLHISLCPSTSTLLFQLLPSWTLKSPASFSYESSQAPLPIYKMIIDQFILWAASTGAQSICRCKVAHKKGWLLERKYVHHRCAQLCGVGKKINLVYQNEVNPLLLKGTYPGIGREAHTIFIVLEISKIGDKL